MENFEKEFDRIIKVVSPTLFVINILVGFLDILVLNNLLSGLIFFGVAAFIYFINNGFRNTNEN